MMRRLITLSILLSCIVAHTAYAQVPVTVVNGAGFQSNFPVAPGCYAQVWGDFGDIQTQNADMSQLPLPTTLAGVQVLVDGTAAPLYAVSSQVCAFIVPQQTLFGRRAIQVTRSGQLIAQGAIDVIAEAPGVFFRLLDDGTPAGGVRNQNADFALETTPARRGEAIVIALTGQGTDLSAPVEDGQAPAGLITTNQQPKVFISGVEAQVEFSGLMPLFPAVWQINARVPDRPFISGPAPLFVTFGGVASNAVVFWVGE